MFLQEGTLKLTAREFSPSFHSILRRKEKTMIYGMIGKIEKRNDMQKKKTD
jgi:hypothetical protein